MLGLSYLNTRKHYCFSYCLVLPLYCLSYFDWRLLHIHLLFLWRIDHRPHMRLDEISCFPDFHMHSIIIALFCRMSTEKNAVIQCTLNFFGSFANLHSCLNIIIYFRSSKCGKCDYKYNRYSWRKYHCNVYLSVWGKSCSNCYLVVEW